MTFLAAVFENYSHLTEANCWNFKGIALALSLLTMKKAIHIVVSLSLIFSSFASHAGYPTPGQIAQTSNERLSSTDSGIRDLDPATKERVVIQSINNTMIRFYWCGLDKEGISSCAAPFGKPIGCRGDTPFTTQELKKQHFRRNLMGWGVIGIDLAIMAAMIGGGWAIFGGGAAVGGGTAAVGGATTALTGGAFTAATSTTGATVITTATGAAAAATAVATGPGSAIIQKTAQFAGQAMPVMNIFTFLQKLSTWSFVGISFTGLLMKYTKHLDPSAKFREADVIEAELWQENQANNWDLKEYRTILQRVLCKIDGVNSN